jgi:1-acyl-sn-glycerol-3-phosphate acyltransferase
MRWVVKDSLFKIPFFGLGLAAAGVVFVKRHSREDASRAFRECETLVQKGNSVFFFPEGTRSLTGKMRSFKTGAFRLAKSQNVLVVPITLSGCAQLLPKGSMMPRPTAVSVTIHPPIDPQDLTLDELIDTAYKTISLPLETQGEFQQKRIHAVS